MIIIFHLGRDSTRTKPPGFGSPLLPKNKMTYGGRSRGEAASAGGCSGPFARPFTRMSLDLDDTIRPLSQVVGATRARQV